MSNGDVPFDPAAPLPAGRFAIEASAGTGKTHTLITLALRYIAEWDVKARDLLVVTFTRAATAELRARLRERLAEAAGYARGTLAAEPSDPDLLEQVFALDRDERLSRIEAAITQFESATVTTIHGFATQVRGMLGAASGLDPDAALVDDTDALLTDVCADLLTERSARGLPSIAPGRRSDLEQAARKLLTIPDLEVAPPAPSAPELALLAELAVEARGRVLAARRRAGTISFDDVLTNLRAALARAGTDSARSQAAELLSHRYRVALIDEFQDTDPVQWDIFSRLFADADPARALVLVGDPKQSIYGFRGADLNTYLAATSDSAAALVRRRLDVSWRAGAGLLAAQDALFSGATFGDTKVRFAPLRAAAGREARGLRTRTGSPIPAITIRVALGEHMKRSSRNAEEVLVDPARAEIDSDLAEQVIRLLREAELHEAPEAEPRSLQPSDIAVLTNRWSEAESIRTELAKRGVPAIVSRGPSVLSSPAAEQWHLLLSALARPSHEALARSAALTWFIGWSAEQLDMAGERESAELHQQLHDWAALLVEHGPATFVQRALRDRDALCRVMSRPDGDRASTDLEHIGELLCTLVPSDRIGPAGLLSALERAATAAQSQPDTDENPAARRIESDAAAVQIMTIHASKGLEFPVVCCPTLWSQSAGSDVIELDPVTGHRRLVLGASRAARQRAGLGEELRLMYVALTRARHHLVVWYTRAQGTQRSPLARLLFGRDEDGRVDPALFERPDGVSLPAAAAIAAHLTPTLEMAGGNIELQILATRDGHPEAGLDRDRARPDQPLAVGHLGRLPARSLHRWSFSAITRRLEDHWLDPHDESLADQGAADEGLAGAPTELRTGSDGVAPPEGTLVLDDLPAGTAFGTFVHELLETVEFDSPQLHDDLVAAVLGHPAWRDSGLGRSARGVEMLDRLASGLRLAIETPLGPVFGGLALRDISRKDRLDEVSFEFHLAGSGHAATDRRLGELLVDGLDPEDPLRRWATALAQGSLGVELSGHMTGSIDAVLRDSRDPSAPRYLVVDYKSNRLGVPGRQLVPADYDDGRLTAAMEQHHYPLQALLYLVALHRFLRWRQPGYRPEQHLAGAAYLFVRGMAGPSTPPPAGVFAWTPGAAVIVAASDLLAGEHAGVGSS